FHERIAFVRAGKAAHPQRFQERTHFRLAWRTPQVRRCLCLIAAAAALISTNEWRRGACHSRIKPLLAACVCAVGMWATRLRCPSEAAYPQPAGDSAVGSAAPGGGSGGRLNRFVDKSAAARRMAPSVRLAVGLEGQVAELVNEERTITAHLLEEFGGRPIGQGGVKLVQEGLGVIKTAAMA